MALPPVVLKAATLLIAALGVASSFVVWFLPPPLTATASVLGVTSGLALLYLNALIFLAELKPSLYIEEYLSFLLQPYGKAAYFVLLGLLYGGKHGLSIACWVLYWVLAVVHVLAEVTGEFKFTPLPDSPGDKNSELQGYQAN
jgi:hypothetical protein